MRETGAQREPVTDEEKAGAALRAFFRIAELWKLDANQQMTLLGVPRSTYFHWKRKGARSLSMDTLERISYILGIFRALEILLPKHEAANAWVRKPNAAAPFGGQSALERMLSGRVADLYVVHQYLDAQRGGWS